ncbi:MAG: hypothetical protein N2257_09275 [Thermodesulfovibrionales bacterium]|nr:hypothetical protein [Thermodesulfovibrionales bacterium]
MKKILNPEVWFFLFFTGLLLLNWPFLAIAHKKAWLYLTGIWAFFIGAIALFTFIYRER